MITEDYVSFETAKLLKEKGFDEICYLGYNKNGEYVPTSNRTNSQIIQPDFCYICCPTLQMAMKWLREFHRIEINIVLQELDYHNDRKYQFDIYSNDINNDFDSIQHYGFKSYEEACEAAIKYCLTDLI